MFAQLFIYHGPTVAFTRLFLPDRFVSSISVSSDGIGIMEGNCRNLVDILSTSDTRPEAERENNWERRANLEDERPPALKMRSGC